MFKERVQAAVVILFVLAIAGVVVVLLMRVDRDAAPAADPSSDPTQDLESAAADPIGPVSLVAGKGDLLLRITAGSCTEPGGPEIDMSDNQGFRFRSVKIPQVDEGTGVSLSTPTVRAIVWAKAASRSKITVVAADADCKLSRYETSDGGETWNVVPGMVEQWYIDPKSGSVVSPTGAANPGCQPVIALVPVTKSIAKVFCGDGTIRATNDAGTSWLDAGRLGKVTSAVFTGALVGYASTERPGCKSRIQATVDGGLTWTPRGCIVETVAVPAFTGREKQLIAGGPGGVRVSSDGGSTWTPPTLK